MTAASAIAPFWFVVNTDNNRSARGGRSVVRPEDTSEED
jgi:hypothetical protein